MWRDIFAFLPPASVISVSGWSGTPHIDFLIDYYVLSSILSLGDIKVLAWNLNSGTATPLQLPLLSVSLRKYGTDDKGKE